MKILAALVIIFWIALLIAAFAECTEMGGVVGDCVVKWAAQPRQPISGFHGSADTFALSKATCVTADSVWGFHSARWPDGSLAPTANQVQLQHYRRFPKVVRLARRFFADGQDHVLSGAQLGQLGVPLCRE